MHHHPISDDPDVAQVVDDFDEVALELQRLLGRIGGLALQDPERVSLNARIRTLMVEIEKRAERLNVSWAGTLREVLASRIDRSADFVNAQREMRSAKERLDLVAAVHRNSRRAS